MLAFFDPVSGISGDMALGALLDVGLPLAALAADLAGLAVGGYRLERRQAAQQGLTGTRLIVHLEEEDQPHRHLRDIAAILAASRLAPAVRARALAVFTRLAVAEAAVHGSTAEAVHFHEVGAVDALVDIVGVVAGLDRLGVTACYCGPLPLPLGGGLGHSAHGVIPLPAPATLQILAAVGAPFITRATDRELVTPTGAALVAEVCEFRQPPLRLRAVGVGFGQRDLPWPNVLRVLLCEPWAVGGGDGDAAVDVQPAPETPVESTAEMAQGVAAHDSPSMAHGPRTTDHGPQLERDTVVLLETNIDDMNPQIYGYLVERLLAAGALDAWLTPIQMKKGRPATLVSVLAAEADADALTGLLLRETSTLGVRRRAVDRVKAPRRMVTVATTVGPIRAKARLLDGVWTAQPEYDDCRAAAERTGRPLRAILAEVAAAVQQYVAAEADRTDPPAPGDGVLSSEF